MNKIIEVDELFFCYPGSCTPALRSVGLKVEKGDFAAVVGNNGSGKSTLCKALNGLIPHFHAGSFSGRVLVNGFNTRESTVAELSKSVGYIGQDFETQLVCRTVYEEICFAPLNFGMQDYKERAEKVISYLKLDAIRDKFIWQLSGGHKHLTAIGGILVLDPEIIIVDEPSAQLDPETAGLIYRELQLLNCNAGKTILVIEHHSEMIGAYCKNVIFMEDGQVLWKKPVREALTNELELKQRKFLPPQVTQAAFLCRSSEELNDAYAGKEFPVSIQQAISYFGSTTVNSVQIPPIETKSPGSEKRLIFVENVMYSYRSLEHNRRTVLHGISFTVNEGERIAVVGRNGCGKSTILKAVAGILKPAGGCIEVCGVDVSKCILEELSSMSVYVAQNPGIMFIEDSIEKDIGFYPSRMESRGNNIDLDGILADFNLHHVKSQDGRLLSGGEQKRAALAIGAAMHPSVLLLDEPTASLDSESRRSMLEHLSGLEKYTKAIIAATHDMQLAAEWATRVMVIAEGKLIADDTPAKIFSDSELLGKAGLVGPQIVALSKALGIMPVALSIRDFSRFIPMSAEGRTAEAYEDNRR